MLPCNDTIADLVSSPRRFNPIGAPNPQVHRMPQVSVAKIHIPTAFADTARQRESQKRRESNGCLPVIERVSHESIPLDPCGFSIGDASGASARRRKNCSPTNTPTSTNKTVTSTALPTLRDAESFPVEDDNHRGPRLPRAAFSTATTL